MNNNDYAVLDWDTPDAVIAAADADAQEEYRDAFASYVEGE